MSGSFFYMGMSVQGSNGTMKAQMFSAVGEFRSSGYGRHEVTGMRRMCLELGSASSSSDDDDDWRPNFLSRCLSSPNNKPALTQTSGLDLSQEVKSVKVYKRALNSGSGKSAILSIGVGHQAAVAKTRSGELYMIEKGVNSSTDSSFKECHRVGECRLIKVDKSDIRGWVLIRKLKTGVFGCNVTLKNLFDKCGSAYDLVRDNCIHGVNKICNFLQMRGFLKEEYNCAD